MAEIEVFRENGRIRRGNALYLERYVPGMNYSSNWESPESFARYIQALNSNEAWHKSAWEKGGDFAGSRSMDESLEMARTGWPEGAAMASRVRDRVLAANPVRKQPARYDVAGAYPNVARAVAGDIKNMRVDDRRSSKRRPTITLVANMAAPWFVTATDLSHRAAAIAAIVDQVEAAGFSCEVVATATSKGYGRDSGDWKTSVNILVKSSHQPVDIGRLAFGLGQSSVFRRFVFADWGTEKACERTLEDGLGTCLDLEQTPELTEKSVFILPEMKYGERKEGMFSTEEKTANEGVKYLIDVLRERGCPAFPKEK